jgi:hypothetical protein
MADEQGDWADRAVQMAAKMGRRMADELRELAPRPFGLIIQQGELSTSIGSYAQGSSSEDLASSRPQGERPPLTSLTLCYGTPDDPQSPWIEVFTDFTVDHEDTVSVRYALGKAVGSENARLAGELEHSDPLNPPPGPLERGQLQIVVAGESRTVRTQTYQGFHGLQFSHSGLLVTVIARRSWPDQPEFAFVTDLDPFLAPMELADPEVVKARLRARFPSGLPRPDRPMGDLLTVERPNRR